jgi:hypothetical protein
MDLNCSDIFANEQSGFLDGGETSKIMIDQEEDDLVDLLP